MLLFTVMYLILGCILDVYGMLILTLPFVFPIILKLGFDPIWFGIYVTVMTEIALVTPPVGVSVYVMANIAPEVPMEDIFKGTFPFVAVALGMIGILMAYPEIALWLTRQ
jgi:TRAP-type C4-dicarboxylate transport system permease large subunit